MKIIVTFFIFILLSFFLSGCNNNIQTKNPENNNINASKTSILSNNDDSKNNNSNNNTSLRKIRETEISNFSTPLKSGVAKDVNLDMIKAFDSKIVIENVGGSAYRTLSRVLSKLGISEKFVWFNTEEDPFFHSIGKYDVTPKGEKAFYDYSVDATVLAKKADGTKFFPVIDTLDYSNKLKDYPVGTAVLITDPDHDRLTITQTESITRVEELKRLGVDYIVLDDEKVLDNLVKFFKDFKIFFYF